MHRESPLGWPFPAGYASCAYSQAMPPIIAITSRPRSIEATVGPGNTHAVDREYSDAVLRAGGLPLVVTPVPAEDVGHVLERVDGLILTGGGDIEPDRYGGKHHPTLYGLDAERDEFELALAMTAHSMRLPTLATCRGLQVVNVAHGGTLIEDIPSELGLDGHHVVGSQAASGHQTVTLEEGCLLWSAIGRQKFDVNSIHHQAVRDLGSGLKAVGWSHDGVIEAIASDDGWPLLAVQWHPEYMPTDEPSQRLFAAFVAAASEPVDAVGAG